MTKTAKITYVQGDATNPTVKSGTRVIVHCCNDLGAWGSGFVVAISKKWTEPEQHYRLRQPLVLGSTAIIQVEPDLYVANIVGQHGLQRSTEAEIPPVRYEALRIGFKKVVAFFAEDDSVTVHAPRLGCALAGGDWALVEPLLNATFIRAGMGVWVYDFPGGAGFFDSRTAS